VAQSCNSRSSLTRWFWRQLVARNAEAIQQGFCRDSISAD
jgi:hypothetical protein